MKKTLFTLLAACCFMTSCKEEKKNDIVIGTSADYKPFMFYDNGALTGFEKELFDEIAKRMKRNPVYRDMSFDGLVGGLQANRLDVAVACISRTEERSKNVDFSEPYYGDYGVVLVHKDSPISSLADLKDKSVGVQMGSTHEIITNQWQQQGRVSKIVSLSKIPELIQEWKNKRIDAVFVGNSEAKGVAESQPDMKIVSLKELGTSFVSFALPKGSPHVEEINTILADLTKDGTMTALLAKWKL